MTRVCTSLSLIYCSLLYLSNAAIYASVNINPGYHQTQTPQTSLKYPYETTAQESSELDISDKSKAIYDDPSNSCDQGYDYYIYDKKTKKYLGKLTEKHTDNIHEHSTAEILKMLKKENSYKWLGIQWKRTLKDPKLLNDNDLSK